MASSDDEGEAVPHTVSNYHFVDDKDEPIAFSELPVQWNEGEGLDGNTKQIFLHGTTDNGLQKIYKQVTAWKFDLSNVKPEMSVLSKENNWIKLQKPRKSFEETIRSILITVHCLHFMKKNPETCGRSLWDHLSKVFSSYEARPSENDLIDHTTLINEAVKRDETLAKSKFLVTFLEEKPWKKRAFDEENGTTTKTGFIVDDDMIDKIDEDDGSDEEDDLFDSVCAICDNGGELLCCEGRCMRSFHATVEAGSESTCESLGLSDEQVDAIQNFFCANCKYKQHQCFSCGELGSSDKLSGAEVFPCVSATCGRFYHPHCVAKLLHRESAAEAEEIQKKIAAGESFTCPIHKCIVCKQGENKMDPDFQFAVCRRCPKSYHRKCLPRKIAFEDLEDEGIIQRAWEGLMPNRILIYCLKHEIDDEIGTPIRNHIMFPGDGQKKKKQISQQLSSKEKVLKKVRSLASEDAFRKRTLGKVQKGVGSSSTIKEVDSSKKSVITSTGPNYSKKQKVADASIKLKRKSIKSTGESGPSLGVKLYDLYGFMKKGSESPDTENKQTPTDKPVAKKMSSQLALDEDTKRRILALMKDATSSVTLEEITKKHKVPTTHAYSSKYVVDKAITLGKVEGSVEALRAALQKLEEGCSIEDAKAVCEPGLLHQIIRWKNKLRVYLAPFLYGMRYTSFGRHFTKVDKLKEIVNVLHCYIQDGDMVVDFCCGANDFSWLMKKQLDETGKKCSYKNYDVLQAKNDFNFEKRDWMSVRPKELPPGSQLIMGLNPPFGVNASLANKFIDKALEFRPKLLILIVPRETESLDKKKTPYDLVWEDDELLVGKSFYLPGSVDVNDNQMEDWNVNPPPLYLWSRPDWTARHKAIAQRHGHLSRVREQTHLQENHNEPLVSDYPMKDKNVNSQTSMPMDDHPVQSEVQEQLQERGASVSENHKDGFPRDNADREVHEKHSHGKNGSNEDSNKRRRDKGKQGRGSGEASQKGREKRRSSPLSEMYNRRPRRSPTNVTGGRSLEGRSSRPLEAPSHMEVSKEGDQHFEQSVAGSRSHFQTGYGGVHSDGIAGGYGGALSDDIARRYGSNGEEPYSGGTHRWSSGATPGPDYGVRNSEEQFAGYQREGIETHGYRSYVSEIEERHARESAMRSQVRHYGQQDPNTFGQRSSFLAGQDNPAFSSSYSYNMGSAADSSYGMMNMSTSTMQRYAPRLDELNHTRMNSLGYEPQIAGRNGIPDPHAPPPGYRVDSLGFAPGPYRSSQQNSSGWLNE